MTALTQVQKLSESDQSAQLAAIASSGACEAGRVIMLDFSVVREQVGARWTAKCEAIWDHTERTIRRHVPATTLFCRADQTSYVISFADMDGFGAQALGFRVMEDVVTHFLGNCSPKDLQVKTVSSVSGSAITASAVPFRPEHLTRLATSFDTARPAVEAMTMPPLVHGVDGQIQQSVGFDYVFNLKIEKPAALRVSSTLSNLVTRRPLTLQEQAALPTPVLSKADLNTINMIDYLFESMPPRLIIAPISMQTLAYTRSRDMLLRFLNKLDHQTRGRFIVEVYGLEDGTPASRLTETTALLRPFCRSVMARIASSRPAISNARAARPAAVNICMPDAGASQARFAAALLASGEAARGVAPMLMVNDLPDKAFMSVCAVAGFTHAAMRSIPSGPGGSVGETPRG